MLKTKINFKNIGQKVFFIIFGLSLAIGASYVSATSRPSSTSTNGPTVLSTGVNDQTKPGSVRTLAFIAGDYISQAKLGFNFMLINNLGVMSLGRNDTPASSLNLGLDIGATTGIKGTIRVKDLESSGTKEVCVDANGKLIFCKGEKVFVSTNYASDYYGFMVPDGVTSMTIEMYGAGGAGYSKNNINTGIDDVDDGQSSYIIGDGVNIVAEGGKGADSSSAGGKGGTVVATEKSKASNISEVSGGDGSAPGSYNPSPIQIGSSDKCGGVTYMVVKGADGNIGGKGGKPYNGANSSGGTAGDAAPTYGNSWNFNTTSSFIQDPVDCNYAGQTSDSYVAGQYKNNRPGGDGDDGASYGAGGAGFGGKGGLSAVDLSINNCTKCLGGQASSGGGAGAYVKADISTKAGATYYLKVGYRGLPASVSCSGSGGTNTCLDDLGGGAKSGSGADGYIKITYN